MDAEERVARWIFHKAGKSFPEGEVLWCSTDLESGVSLCSYGTCGNEYTEFTATANTSTDTFYANFDAGEKIGLGYILEELIEFEKEQYPLMEIDTDGH